MVIATGSNLAKSYGAESILRGVNLEIHERERVALVGVNGSGKSTLMRLMAGIERPDHGTLAFASGARVGYLSQEVRYPEGLTLRQHILNAFRHLLDIEAALREVETRLEAGPSGPELERLLARHERLLHDYEFGGGYTYQNKLREVLAGLGIEESRLDQPLHTFSGGQRTRVALAELLLNSPDLVLLDEPTNHLDLAATEWLEEYLIQAPLASVIVSHDRYFLDKVATRTWEMTLGRIESYTGNYSRYVAQRAERHLRLQREYEAQQKHIAKTEEFIRRYKAGQRSKQARGRQTLLDRLERVNRPQANDRMKLVIQSTLRSGDTVLATEDLEVAAGTPPPVPVRVLPGQPVIREAPRRLLETALPLFRCADLELRRGDRAAVIGPNGSGKTTLLRVINGEAEPAGGRLYLGYGVQLAYYAQAHEQLNLQNTVLQEILTTKPMSEEAARTYLGRFLFSGDDAFKVTGSLSGGERSRLALAKLALGNANFLVLDEPTNHLDIYAREALEEVFNAFPGTILFVSHDRYLIDALATQVWEVEDGTLRVHRGGWADYLEVRSAERARREAAAVAQRAAAQAAAPAGQAAQQQRERQRRVAAARDQLEQVEAAMHRVEQRLHEVAEEIQSAGAEADVPRLGALGKEHASLTEELAQIEDQWLALRETLEADGQVLDAVVSKS